MRNAHAARTAGLTPDEDFALSAEQQSTLLHKAVQARHAPVRLRRDEICIACTSAS